MQLQCLLLPSYDAGTALLSGCGGKDSRHVPAGLRVLESRHTVGKDTGEIRQDVDIEDTAMLFRQVFFGLSFEQSFLRGLDIQRLARELRFVYSLLKA